MNIIIQCIVIFNCLKVDLCKLSIIYLDLESFPFPLAQQNHECITEKWKYSLLEKHSDFKLIKNISAQGSKDVVPEYAKKKPELF